MLKLLTIAPLLCASLTSAILLRGVLQVAHKRRLYDSLSERKLHTHPTPRLGGVAFIPSLFLAFEVCRVLFPEVFLQVQEFGSVWGISPAIYPMAAIFFLYTVGFLDDVWDIKASYKLFTQVLVVLLLYFCGWRIADFYGLLGQGGLPCFVDLFITCMVYLLIINAINLIDGVDGLASGVCIVAFAFYAILFYQFQSYGGMVLALSGLGALIPFVYYNVWGSTEKKTKIFMGDTGSLLLGLVLCILAVQVLLQGEGSLILNANTLILAFSPLFMAGFDVVRVFANRISRGISPFRAEKNHIHHYFIACGYSHRRTALSLILISLGITVETSLLSCYVEPTLLLGVNYVLWYLFVRYMKYMSERSQDIC